MSALSLQDAKTHLNITTSQYDVELQEFIDSAEAIIARKTGPLVPTTITRRLLSNGYNLVLPVTPVISLTSATSLYGYTPVVANLFVDSESGVVSALDGRSNFFTQGWYDVTWEAGYTEVPADLLHGVKEMVKHLWKSQRGGATRPGSAADAQAPTAGYLIPYAVEAAIAPHANEFGFA